MTEDFSGRATVGFEKLLGLEYLEVSGDRLALRFEITPELHQPYGIVHGGVYCAAVETAASVAAATWAREHVGGQVVGVSNHTNFLRATREGSLTAVATPVHRGRTQQLWQVEITDDSDRLVARGEVRLANIGDADRLARQPSS